MTIATEADYSAANRRLDEILFTGRSRNLTTAEQSEFDALIADVGSYSKTASSKSRAAPALTSSSPPRIYTTGFRSGPKDIDVTLCLNFKPTS